MSRFGFSLHVSKYLFFFGKGCLSISNINWLEFKVIFFLLGQASRRGIDRIKVFGDSMLVMNVMLEVKRILVILVLLIWYIN